MAVRLGRLFGFALVVAVGLTGRAGAQDLAFDRDQPVALTADSIFYDTARGTVTAEGSVEVFYGERTLTAERIVYDSRADRITATGEITLRDPSGITLFADMAELDAELRDGLIRGARGVIDAEDGTAKLAAVEARRYGGRYNALSKAVYSPCEVCRSDPTPLWRIRARRIIHDEEARVIHYEDATFDVFGVPVAYLPYFQHPDPTVERASGFLVPRFLSSSIFGYGIKTPYFIVVDDQTDVTLTPFLMTEHYPIGEFEVRRAYSNGELTIAGSATVSDFSGEETFEGHLETVGEFEIRDSVKFLEGFNWGWDITATTDDGYLRRFDFSSADRLESEVYLRNYGPGGYFDLTGVYFQSLRDNEPAGDIPIVLPVFEGRYQITESLLGGQLGFTMGAHGLTRNEGEDTLRLSIGADWEKVFVTDWGLSLRGFASLRGDLFQSFDTAPGDDDFVTRVTPQAGMEARFPLIYTSEGGTSHILEPRAQFVVSPFGLNSGDIPNEDSLVQEFDETNLFDANRFPGFDFIEEGPRFNLGLTYEIVSDNYTFDATVGRVLRFSPDNDFSVGSGLNGTESDYVAALGIEIGEHVSLRNRLRIDTDFAVARNEIFGNLSWGPVEIEGSYLFLAADPGIQATEDRQEASLRTSFAITDNWTIGSFVQRDLETNEFVETSALISYQNECCVIDLFIRRRFTDSEDAPASTSAGIQINLLTLGTSSDGDGR